MNDAAAVQNHNGAAFNHLNDPNIGANMLDPTAFMGTPTSSFVDPSQFQNQQMQRMHNGGMRNPSPAFNNPVYQTNPIVPSKRPRPREDSMGSPRQAPGMLPNSRSQTPQQAYPGFQGNANQPVSHQSQPTPYSHLQHNGSANATPSPVMSNQLRPSGVPQRVSTASPHPFSPAVPQFGPQASPSQSEHGSRGDTPQNPYIQNPAFSPGFNQSFTPPQGRTVPPPQPGVMGTPQMPQMAQSPMQQQQMQQPQMQPPHMYQQQQQQQQSSVEQQKMIYQMQLQQLNRNGMMNAQRMQNMPQNPNAMAKPQMPTANGQYVQGMRPQQPVARPNNPEQFMKHLTSFMQARGLTLDMNPIVGDRTINIIMLYMAVTKFGGYRRVNQANLWNQVAQSMGFNPMQSQSAPAQIKGHYERNLMMFEEAYASQQRQKAMMQQSSAGNMGPVPPQMSPTKQMNMQGQMAQGQQFMRGPPQQQQHMVQQSPQVPPQQALNTPVKQMSHVSSGQQPAINGFSTPQMANNAHQTPQAHRNSLPRSADATPGQNGTSFAVPSPASGGKARNLSLQSSHEDGLLASLDLKKKRKSSMYDPRARPMTTWGGVNPEALDNLCIELVNLRPNVPSVYDLGVIDIHALTMSLQSGIHSEVRLALDTLATLSVEPRLQLDLKACEDLVESIVDCAEIQIELLAENAAEVSDVMLISSYEDVARGCRLEREGLQDVPEFGSLEYDLDRAVERLICITTILRNLSFYETNHPLLAEKLVLQFICVVIRYLGTRNMLLRTHSSTLDLMKDLIIFLSNLAQAVEIPGKEQALCLLHFLLAFAPCPPPGSSNSDKVIFSPYDPSVHRYLPPAVDSLAKLLARDEPNRTFYKKIFASDATSLPPYDLLTKSFALAISPIPGQRRDEQRVSLMQTVDARKPHLMQGMLAAEILANLVPGFETGLARSWLTSEDGFSQSLLRLITVLSTEPSTPPPARGAPIPNRGADDEALLHITLSAITVLRRLSEKSRNPDDSTSKVPIDGMIKQENLLGALLLRPPTQPKAEVIKQLCAYAKLDM
jgi:SWI/SNF chromatin-remodeling complex subunit SWI1